MLFFFAMGGCGYSSKSLLRSNVRSIYIPIFDNDTFRRGYEFDLTRAVRDQVLLRTRLRIVDKEEADSILLGKISSVNENVLIEDRKDNIVESRVTIRADIRWVDTRTGRTIVERKNIKGTSEFIVLRNESLTSSSDESFVKLAQSIVESMEEEWW
ncbi:MAG: LptE family protein [Candidatus Kuenenia sp.]|nr:LptE family protein [Candidatus Kuenenia hertensis]